MITAVKVKDLLKALQKCINSRRLLGIDTSEVDIVYEMVYIRAGRYKQGSKRPIFIYPNIDNCTLDFEGVDTGQFMYQVSNVHSIINASGCITVSGRCYRVVINKELIVHFYNVYGAVVKVFMEPNIRFCIINEFSAPLRVYMTPTSNMDRTLLNDKTKVLNQYDKICGVLYKDKLQTGIGSFVSDVDVSSGKEIIGFTPDDNKLRSIFDECGGVVLEDPLY